MSRYQTQFSYDGRPLSRDAALQRHRNFLAQRQMDVLSVLPNAIAELNSNSATSKASEELDRLTELEHALLEAQIVLLNAAERRLEDILIEERRRLGLSRSEYSNRTANSGSSAGRSRQRRNDDDSLSEN